jgi:hypothetical protein
MVPHERELAKRYANQPFAIVGVNGDMTGIALGPNADVVTDGPKLKKIIEKEGIT